MKNQKGITLIALVITIIVLLILAGVSIAMLTGENGILTQANSAKSETNKAEATEKISLALNAVKAKVYEEEVGDSTYDPAANGETAGLNSKIVTLLTTVEKINQAAGTDADDGKYVYSFTNKVLTISYYNKTTEVTTISGTINLDKTSTTDYLKIQ